MRLYPKESFAVRHGATRNGTGPLPDHRREQLRGIHFDEQGRTWATDGHQLIRFTPPKDVPSASDYPVVKGQPKHRSEKVEPFTFPLDVADQVRKAIPKAKRGTLPVLRTAALVTEASNGEPTARFVTTDLEHIGHHETRKIAEPPCDWPRKTAEEVLEKSAKNPAKVSLDVELLECVLKAVREARTDSKRRAVLEIRFDPDHPDNPLYLRFGDPDGGELEATIMPLRI